VLMAAPNIPICTSQLLIGITPISAQIRGSSASYPGAAVTVRDVSRGPAIFRRGRRQPAQHGQRSGRLVQDERAEGDSGDSAAEGVTTAERSLPSLAHDHDDTEDVRSAGSGMCPASSSGALTCSLPAA